MDGIAMESGGGPLAERHHEAVCRLYDAVFSRPPFAWNEAESRRHADMLIGMREEAGFGLALATGADLVGFAYGLTLPVDHRWWTGFARPLPATVTAERPGRTFALVDLAVAESHRGRGLGRSLVETLLAGRGEERAVLTVQPTALRTQAFYRHLGWRFLGRRGPFDQAVSRYWDCYTMDLAPGPDDPRI